MKKYSVMLLLISLMSFSYMLSVSAQEDGAAPPPDIPSANEKPQDAEVRTGAQATGTPPVQEGLLMPPAYKLDNNKVLPEKSGLDKSLPVPLLRVPDKPLGAGEVLVECLWLSAGRAYIQKQFTQLGKLIKMVELQRSFDKDGEFATIAELSLKEDDLAQDEIGEKAAYYRVKVSKGKLFNLSNTLGPIKAASQGSGMGMILSLAFLLLILGVAGFVIFRVRKG